ncbi:MFS transporter [Haloferula sp.]|uniref:MFS transporter n=1 Tax=Haloferula sp. TaxID=2497595 RepID=UPI00329BB729
MPEEGKETRSPRSVIGLLGLVFFLLGMSPGFYIPALTNILTAKGLGSDFVQWAWMAGPVAALLSPVSVGALADNRFEAQKILGSCGLMGSVVLGAAFVCLEQGYSPWLFIGLKFVSSIVSAPMWSMMASISMTHLKCGEKEFPLVRLGGTVGWFAAGFVTSYVLKADGTVVSGYAAAVVGMLAGLVAFALPSTPPRGRSRSLRTLLGFDAFKLLKERDHFVFFVVTGLLSIPLAAFYMWTPKHLAELGDTTVTATMALGQISEIVAMLVMASLMTRLRVKTLLTLALVLSAIRYGLFAWSGVVDTRTGLTIGIALHGMCYTFYFITAQMFLDRRVPVEVRSQAQGLLSMFSMGIGTLLGTIVVRKLYDEVVVEGVGGWSIYWAILGGFIAALTLVFVLSYVGVAPKKKSG